MISMRWRPGLLLGLTLSGCNPVPSGQVAASVDGVEITRREVLLELEASPAPTGTSPQQAERLALEKLIDRKLLLSGARDMLIDRSPDFQIRARRGRELALVDQLVARLRAQQTQPDAAAIDRFIAAHPQIFAERRQIVVDRIAVGGNAAPGKELGQAPDNDAVAAQLAQRGLGFSREIVVIDTADMPDAPVPGGPPKIVATGNGGMRFDAALLTRPVVMDRSTMQARAREQILDQATRAALQDFLKDRRRAALIQEQPAPAAQR